MQKMTENKRRPWLLASLLLAPLPQLVIAADADPAAGSAGALPTVTVYAATTVEQARQTIEQTAGGVALVGAEAWRNTPSRTIKDVLDYTPGVFAQPKWGEDTRLSIRGSSLSRNYHLRGVTLLQDGMPLNAADGSADFQEIDPTAYLYTEVYKGANALRYGANSLGGALNFVTPTGDDLGNRGYVRVDAGGDDFYRLQLAGGGRVGAVDGYLSAAALKFGGYRDHSTGDSQRTSGNLGIRLGEHAQTRFYLLATDIEQEIPGSVTRDAALHDPKAAAASNIALNQQRNMQTWRLANKTMLQWQGLSAEFGVSAADKQLIHPIYQYLDYEYHDFGGFGRLVLDHPLAGLSNRLTAGVNVSGGWVDNTQSQNLPGAHRGQLLSASTDRSNTLAAYVEDGLRLGNTLTLIAGSQYLSARRTRSDEFADASDTSGQVSYDFFSPKAGVLWQLLPTAQIFANVSRSGEVPTFGELNFTNAALADTKAQRATTCELGSRGRLARLDWEVSVYHARLRHEFQYFDLGNSNYQVTNADRTIHRGIEAGAGWTLAQTIFAPADALHLRLAWTYSDFRFDDDAQWGNNDLPGAPRQFWRTELVYRSPSGFFAGPDVEWVPQAYFVDNANTTRTADYALLGLRAGYEAGRRWSVYVDGRNLSDRHYIASSSVAALVTPASALYEPGSGMMISAGLTVHW